jgi:hypothetical protein
METQDLAGDGVGTGTAPSMEGPGMSAMPLATSSVPQQQPGIRVPVPACPLPLNFLVGLVMMGNDPIILCTALNDSGSMTQGFIQPEVANKIGRALLQASREAEIRRPKKLEVVGKGALLVPQ